MLFFCALKVVVTLMLPCTVESLISKSVSLPKSTLRGYIGFVGHLSGYKHSDSTKPVFQVMLSLN